MFSLAILTALVSPAAATIRTTTVTAQADNVLRYTVNATTTESAQIAVRVWRTGTPPTSGWTTEYSAVGRSFSVPIWGLAPSTSYQMAVLVDPVIGLSYSGASRRVTTAALPADFPTIVTSGTPDFDYFMFDGVSTTTGDGMAVILDDAGAVRWYQPVPVSGEEFHSLFLDESNAQLYGLSGLDHLVRYDLDGTLSLDWQFGDVLQDLVHHDLVVHDGVVYVLTIREFTRGFTSYLEDGIQGYDEDGNLVYEWWIRDGGFDVVNNAPVRWPAAGTSVYAPYFPNGVDWVHANGLAVYEEAGSLKAYVTMRAMNQVIKVDMDTGAIEWVLGQAGGTASEAGGTLAMDKTGVSTDWPNLPHHGHFEEVGGSFVLFDNGNGGREDSRGLLMTIDESAATVRIDRAVDFSDFLDSDFDGVCDDRGSAYLSASDSLLMTCATSNFAAQYDASDTLVWTFEAPDCDDIDRVVPLGGIAL